MITSVQILLGVMLLAGFAVSGLSLMRAHARETAMQKRVASVVTSPVQFKPVGMSISLFAEERSQTNIVARLTGIFGFDLDKQDHYVLKWYVALGACFGLAYIVTAMGSALISDYVRIATPLVWVVLCRFFFKWCVNRRKDKLFRQFPDALAMIVRSVRVGIPVTEAVRAVAREQPEPTGPEFHRLAHEVGIGVPFDDALLTMAERNDVAEYRFFATALSLQNQTGGALSETLENLAEVIRKRVAVRERGSALASEAKTSAGVLAALPPLSGLGLWALNPDYIGILFHDPAGKKVLFAAIGMLFGGIMVMRSIIQRSLR